MAKFYFDVKGLKPEPSAAQKKQYKRFAKAAEYARGVLADPGNDEAL